MSPLRSFLLALQALACTVPALPGSPNPPHVHRNTEALGAVYLPTSCGPRAHSGVQRGLSLLHHMMYEDAADAFVEAADAEPGCAIAYWGQSMSLVHPLWSDPPDAGKFRRGRQLLETALRQEGIQPQERAYIGALEAYYTKGRSAKEIENLRQFAAAWRQVHQQFPDDPDAALFCALGELATADPADKSFAQQKRAGQLIENVLARYPEHPGAHHYIIHAYDLPALAPRALAVAREYGKIAPEVPHALHMPSHIFTRLGFWEESIAWNQRSAAAAINRPVAGAVSIHYLHALDYLVYAYLQRGEDAKAVEVAATMERVRPPVQVELASAYAFAAIPARLLLERQDWRGAANLRSRSPDWYPWDGVPAVEAISHFARALGAARIGDPEVARQSLAKLAKLRERAAVSSEYWEAQVEIQRLSALAWLQYWEGMRTQALETMRQATSLEASTEKHPVTPGEVLPARELLADMLFARGEFAAAEVEYRKVLERSPNRALSLFGAARSASRAAHDEVAVEFYLQAAALTAAADGGAFLAERRRAKLFLGKHRRATGP
jgi:tetratricopeptide (TPR) repeat protein